MIGRAQHMEPPAAVPGGRGRAVTLAAALLASALAVVLVLPVQGWHHEHHFRHFHQNAAR